MEKYEKKNVQLHTYIWESEANMVDDLTLLVYMYKLNTKLSKVDVATWKHAKVQVEGEIPTSCLLKKTLFKEICDFQE